jgi:hypothetical protein
LPGSAATKPVPQQFPLTAEQPQVPEDDATAPTTLDITRSVPTEGTPIMTKAQQENFARTHLPNRVQLHMNEQFGKDTKNQWFASEVCFCHTFVHLFPFLSPTDLSAIHKASYRAVQFTQLLNEHTNVNFTSLKGYDPDWRNKTELLTE